MIFLNSLLVAIFALGILMLLYAYYSRLYYPVHAAKSLQSCLTLGNPMDCNLPGFSAHGILQARTLEWVAISFSICMLDKGIKLNAES